ncbi:MAG: hypothetical protein SFV19_08835 [Rhodospirillaceae bacterium]|nr:hypothetical protein [Rhodospirillaceae bacterium]
MIWPAFRSDIWHVGILHAPMARVMTAAPLRDVPVTWLPEREPFQYFADPFGLWRDGVLHVFVEDYDYRDKRGTIRRFSFDRDLALRDQATALATPFHLSYPFLIEDGGEVFMLPEAHRSGKLTLYRAKAFPDGWERVCDLLDVPAIDASVIRFEDRWWMFHALPGPDQRALRELHIATAPALTGPWRSHEHNPVRAGLDGARPGGTPFVRNGRLHVPMQDCRDIYGGAVNVLRVDELSDQSFKGSAVRTLAPADIASPFTDGLHTLSACGEVTLIDANSIDRSPRRALVDWQRRWRRVMGAVRGR